MKTGRSFRISKLARKTHLFLALFLTPWIVMYALSTMVMHHRTMLTGQRHRVEPAYDTVREQSDFKLADEQNLSSEEAARQILDNLRLSGAFTVRGDWDAGQLTILRDRPIGSYRIRYDRQANTLKVERQQFGWAYFLEMLHRRRGFQQDYWANDLWAFVVDGVVLAIILWAATGLWMWLGISRTRRMGLALLGGGLILFCLFLAVL